MDQSDADWGDWSLNNDGGVRQMEAEVKDELVDNEQRLTAYDEEPQKEPVELRMYDDEAGVVSGSGESEGSDIDDLDDTGGELQKELLSRTERGPLGQLQPQGMVMCEYCGRLGVRDAFYSKTKRFCSVNCSKSFSVAQKDGKPTPYTLLQASMSQNNAKGGNYLKSQYIGHGGIKFGSGGRAFDWSEYINQTKAQASPVSCYKHCLMSDSWDNIAVGMKVEVINTDCVMETEAYWIATVIQLAGYRAQLRYEGFGNDSSSDFWMNLCHIDIHPVGWCASNGKPLVPPKSIQHKYLDWKDFLVKRLTGARTLPQNFYDKVQECLNNTSLKKGMFVEVVDKMCVSAMRVAQVQEVIGGRLKLHYVDSKVENDEFWCHQESALVHHVGWAQMVGHKLHASAEYKLEASSKKQPETKSTSDMFPKMKDPPGSGKFQAGMKLEAIDPLNLSSICVATVQKVLRNNYLMIGIDGSAAEVGTDWFCYHATSPCIFPVGFCEINNLELTPPRGHRGPFKWLDYLKQTKSVAAPVKLFDKSIPRHGFKVGMKIEAVDLMEPRLICVSTIKQVVGRLLRVHFDGWEDSYDQWVDCQSVDIYPVGWCEMVGYHLEGPRPKEPIIPQMLSIPIKKRKSKSQIYRGPRKKRKPKNMPLTPVPAGQPGSRSHHSNSLDSSDISQDSFSTATSDHLSTTGAKDDGDGIQLSSTEYHTVAPSKSPAPSKSSLASSLPSITNILNSPVPSAQGSQSLPQATGAADSTGSVPSKPAAIGTIKSRSASTGTLSPSSSPSSSHVFTVQTIARPPSMHPLTSPTTATVHLTPIFIHNIPRIIPGEPDKDCLPPIVVNSSHHIAPSKWSVVEVCQFLRINDCGAHFESFRKRNIDGPAFQALTKEQIVNLTGMKVGPSLKIYDLIQCLKERVSQQEQQGYSVNSEAAVGSNDTSETGGAHVTASVVLKQGLVQQTPNQQIGESCIFTKQLIKTPHVQAPVSQHTIALKAQLT